MLSGTNDCRKDVKKTHAWCFFKSDDSYNTVDSCLLLTASLSLLQLVHHTVVSPNGPCLLCAF